MPSELAEEINDLKQQENEVQDAVRRVVEDALAGTDLVSVYNVKQGYNQGSVKVQLEYSGIEELLHDLDDLQGLEISLNSGDIYVEPEGN